MTFRGGVAITGTFISFLLLLTAVHGQNSNDTAVRIGNDAVLTCDGVTYDGVTQHWEKNPALPVKYLVAIQTPLGQTSPGAPVYDADNIAAAGLTGRFTATDDLMTATITAVRDTDDGNFRCASGGTGNEITYRLTTYKLPSVTTDPAGVGKGYVGGTFEVSCRAPDSKPAASFNWTKQGDSSIITSGATLRISSLTMNDTGTYVCTAYHQYASDTASVQLMVSEEPTDTPTSSQGQSGDTKPTSATRTGGGIGTGGIVGAVIGVIAALAIIAALVYFLLIREKKPGKGKEDGVESGDADVTYHATGHPGAPENMSRPPPNQPEVMYAELDLEKQPAGSRRPYVAAPDDPPTEYASIRPNKPPRSSVPHTLAPDEKSEYASVSKPGTRY